MGMGASCTVQLDFASESGAPPAVITVKNKKGVEETIPVYTNKDTVKGTVRKL